MKLQATALTLLAGALLPRVSAADDTSELQGLLDESVVSAASKAAETTSLAPATSASISADDLRRYGIRTIDEAINYLAMGMQLEKLYHAAEIGSRGVLLSRDVGAHVLLLIDGHAVNEQWGGTAYYDRGTGVPLEMVDHIELVLGPGSVLYGSNAMLGIVNIVTKRGKDFAGAHAVVESELPINVRAALGYGREFSLFGHDADVVLELEHFEQKGPTLEYPRYEADPDPITQQLRLYSPGEPPGIWGGAGDDASMIRGTAGYLRLRAGGFEMGLRGMSYRRSHPADSGNFDDPESFTGDRWLSADIKYSQTLGRIVQGSIRFYADHYDYRQDWGSYGAVDCLDGQTEGCMWRLRGHAEWAGLEPQLSFDWLGNRSLVTLVGVDSRVKHVGSNVHYHDYRDGSSPGPVGPFERSEQSLGAYLQNTWWPIDRIGLNLGARWDADSRFGNALSPRAALTTVPWSGSALKLIYSEAFRAPTAWDVYYTDPRSQIPGGEGIEPEGVRNVEATVEQRWGSQRAFAGVFQSWWHDLVVLEKLTPDELAAASMLGGPLLPDTLEAWQLRNVSEIRSRGLNFGFDGSLVDGALRYGLTLTYARARLGRDGATSQRVPVAAPTIANAQLSYALGAGLPTLALAARYASRRPIDEYNAGDPRFIGPLVQLRATVSGELPVPGLSFRVSADYASRGEGPYVVGATRADGLPQPLIPMDQLRAFIGLQYDFFE